MELFAVVGNDTWFLTICIMFVFSMFTFAMTMSSISQALKEVAKAIRESKDS